MRYTGPQGKKARRLGQAFTSKQAKVLQRRPTAPGQHGTSRGRLSEFGQQLKEKQKAKFAYGIAEKQFYRYFLKAQKLTGVTGENLLKLLEQRLDNVVYRLGYAETRSQARQMVSHGFFQVEGKTVNIPSFSVKVGQTITVKPAKAKTKLMLSLKEKLKNAKVPQWLDLKPETNSAKILSEPFVDELTEKLQTQSIVEHYSRI